MEDEQLEKLKMDKFESLVTTCYEILPANFSKEDVRLTLPVIVYDWDRLNNVKKEERVNIWFDVLVNYESIQNKNKMN